MIISLLTADCQLASANYSVVVACARRRRDGRCGAIDEARPLRFASCASIAAISGRFIRGMNLSVSPGRGGSGGRGAGKGPDRVGEARGQRRQKQLAGRAAQERLSGDPRNEPAADEGSQRREC